jgi:hypothetical protein
MILPDASDIPDLPDVVNDLDWDYEPDEKQMDVGRALENRTKLEEKVKNNFVITIASRLYQVLLR